MGDLIFDYILQSLIVYHSALYKKGFLTPIYRNIAECNSYSIICIMLGKHTALNRLRKALGQLSTDLSLSYNQNDSEQSNCQSGTRYNTLSKNYLQL